MLATLNRFAAGVSRAFQLSPMMDPYNRGPTSDFWYGSVQMPTAAGVPVDEETALNYSAVWCATMVFAGTIGKLPINLHRKRNGERIVVEDDHRHAMVKEVPNRDMNAMAFKTVMVPRQLNGGLALAEIIREPRTKRAMAMWPILPSRATHFYNSDGELMWRVKNAGGKPDSEVPDRNMLRLPSIITCDGIRGKGIVENARESIGFGIATEQFGANFFGTGGGVPRVVIEHPGKPLGDDERQTFRREWKEIYGGPTGDKVALLSGGAKASALSLSAEDSQFLGTREHNVNEIARWYNIPPHRLGDLRRATFSNIEEMGISFVRDSLSPWLTLWEQELDKKLLMDWERREYYFEFNTLDLMQGDQKARNESYGTGVMGGWLSPNEVRERENLNPYEGGDVYMVQGAMVPIDRLGEKPEPADSPPPAPMPEDDDDENEDEEDDDSADGELSPMSDAIVNLEAEFVRLRGDLLTGRGAETRADEERERIAGQVREAARLMLRDSLGRVVRKHATAARRAAKSPETFLAWNDEFAAANEASFTSELAKAVEVCGVVGLTVDAGRLVESHLTTARDELLSASDATRDEFPAAVETCVTGWLSGRSDSLIEAECPTEV